MGKTSLAAATARRCASSGLRTVVLSTDAAHSLADCLDVELGARPTRCGPNLFAHEVRAQSEMERHWRRVQEWLSGVLSEGGVDPITAEELTVPPGLDELFSLIRIQEHQGSGDWDLIVVDCAATSETLRLLSFPEVAAWWLEKLFSRQRSVVSAARPLARGLLDVPLPDDAVLDDVRRLLRNLVTLNGVLRDRSTTSIRLVLTPERMVVREAMRTFTYLNLYGYLTDAVIVNRVIPEAPAGALLGSWRKRQEQQLEEVRSAFSPLPVLLGPLLPEEVIGDAALDRLGDEVFGDGDPAALLFEQLSQELVSENGHATLRLPVPFADRDEIRLKKIGSEVIVRVGGWKRMIVLPPAMAAYRAGGARLEDGTLRVRFERESDGADTADRA